MFGELVLAAGGEVPVDLGDKFGPVADAGGDVAARGLAGREGEGMGDGGWGGEGTGCGCSRRSFRGRSSLW